MNKQKQFIPCDCPKGGVYSDGQVCQKCGGTEYIEQKQSEFNIVESANKIKKLIEQKQSWEERFDNLISVSSNKPKYTRLGESVKKFISQEIQKATAEADRKAREEERERIIGIIKENHQGAFTDDGGNNCWYVDELIEIINK